MPPERTLTDADIQALAATLQSMHCDCPFSNDEVSAVRDLLKLMQETRSNILKGIVALLVVGIGGILVLGLKVWAKQ